MLQFFLSSWRSGFRDGTFFHVFALEVAIVALAYLSTSFSPPNTLTVSLDVALSGLSFSLVLCAITLALDLVG